MADLKILRVDKGDSQKNLVDKINQNFSNILSFGGGPYGKTGKSGVIGDQGPVGPMGSYGNPGQRGSIWSVTPYQPSSPILGDFWVDVLSYNQVYKYDGTSWALYDLNLRAQDILRTYGPLTSTSNYVGYFNSSQNPGDYTLALSDSSFLPSGSSKYTFNPQSSKIVISTDGTIPQRRILEFSKSEYTGTQYSKFPSFSWIIGPTSGKDPWETGSTAENGSYGVSFKVPDGLTINTSNAFTISSSKNFYSYSNGISIKTSSGSPLIFNSVKNFSLLTGTGAIKASTSNFSTSLNSDTFSINGRFVYSNLYDATRSASAFKISSSFSNSSNLIVYNSQGLSRSSTLLHIRDISYNQDILKVFSNGDFYYLRRFDAIQNPFKVNNSATGYVNMTGNASGVFTTDNTVYWVHAVPSISSGGTGPSGGVLFCNSGIDYVVDPDYYGPSGGALPNVNLGIALWTPSYSTNSLDASSNSGWLNLLNDSESITIRIRMKDPSRTFRFVGLNTTPGLTGSPDGLIIAPSGILNKIANGQVAVLSSDSTLGSSSVEFTIVNLSGGLARSDNQRWFKVYYSTFGGNLIGNQFSQPVPNYGISGVLFKKGSTLISY